MRLNVELGVCRCCGGKVSREAMTCPHCGQPAPFVEPFARAKWEFRRGNRIVAIKLVRETTNMGLKEAKELVDSWEMR